jgi:hypothetical protein
MMANYRAPAFAAAIAGRLGDVCDHTVTGTRAAIRIRWRRLGGDSFGLKTITNYGGEFQVYYNP